MIRSPFILAALLLMAACAPAAEPPPDARNTFHIMALWEPIMREKTTDTEIRREMDRLLAQFGRGNRYHRVGFGFIYPGGKPEMLQRAARLAAEKGLVLGPIIGLQTHGNGLYRHFVSDLRNYQWQNDGQTWAGITNRNRKPDPASCRIPVSPSRYCDAVRRVVEAEARRQAREILGVMREHPGVIAVVNPLIEQGLGGFETADGKLLFNDCGPYATTEFRDWLRHTGRYDNGNGAYAGQGAPADIVGEFSEFQGRLRSPFHDDPTPADANGTGRSFNATFGTDFTTWTLRYHDLQQNPAPLTNLAGALIPTNGPQFVAGGFDNPRGFKKDDPFWRAWTWVNQDHGGYPPGNPRSPAFGFAQVMARNYVLDVFNWLIAEGLPKDRLYAHQVPTEALGRSPTALMQARTMAMTVWTGYVPACDSVGVTRFGPIDPLMMTQYAPHWGIFEWHPAPGAKPDEQRLYNTVLRDLENYYRHGCRFLFPGWWNGNPNHPTTFPLDDSRFADAIRDFLSKRPDAPVK